MTTRYALRDLSRQWKFSLFFIINLSIGLSGFVTLETFKNALQDHLQNNAKEILAADLSVESRRELSEIELSKLQKNKLLLNSEIEQTVVYSFFAMASVADKSKLVSIKAVEDKFPFYGTLELKGGKKNLFKEKPSKEALKIPKAWVYPELLEQFNIKVGDEIRLGKLKFIIEDVIEKDSTQTFRSASLAPRIYISLDFLKPTELIQYGSTFSKEILFKLKPETDINKVSESIYKDIQDPSVRVITPDTASEDAGRQLHYLSDYLGLVSLISLFLSALGAAYLFRLYILEKIKDIAILQSLGLSFKKCIRIYMFETILLGISALVISFLLTVAATPFLSHFLSQLVPFSLNLKISASVFVSAFFLSLFGSLCISLPFLLRIRDVSISQLFSEEHFQSQMKSPQGLSLIPAIILFALLSVSQSHSLKIGIGFCLGFILVLLILTFIGWISLTPISRLKISKWSVKYSLLSLSRKKSVSLTLFVSLALGTLLINILPQLKVTLQNSLSSDEGAKLPSLFIFDIQEDQLVPFKTYLEEKKIPLLNLSPLIRSRILKVNNLNFERTIESESSEPRYRTREEERDARFRNRGVNLTYRSGLSTSEEIVAGKPFSGHTDPQLAEISVENHYAERLGFKIGDLLTFDVQGVEFKGQIVNFRSVKWTSFQPNFFIVVQPGFLEEAPKTFIAAVPKMNQVSKTLLQHSLAEKFSNVSSIDVDHLVADVLKIAEQMSLSLELMAWLSVIAGMLILYSIVRTQIQTRRWELNMLKILGAKRLDLKIYLLSEFLIITVIAALAGAFLSLITSSFLSTFIFESGLKVNFLWILSSVFCVSFFSFIVAWFAAQKVMNESPLHLLN